MVLLAVKEANLLYVKADPFLRPVSDWWETNGEETHEIYAPTVDDKDMEGSSGRKVKAQAGDTVRGEAFRFNLIEQNPQHLCEQN